MDTWESIGNVRRELLAYAREVAGRVARMTTTTANSADGTRDAVENYSLPDEDKTQEPSRRIAPWGLAGVPLTGLTGLVVRVLGNAAQSALVGIAHPQYARSTLAEGETQLYCKTAGAEVYLDKDGKNNINSASGQDIVLNAGTAKVGRVGDGVGNGTLAFTVVMGVGALALAIASITVLYTPGDGSAPQTVGPLMTGNLTGLVTIKEKIVAGAANVKA